MLYINQEFLTDIPNRVYGDCQRACIAALLHLPRREVPHFLENCKDKQNVQEFNKQINQFLNKRNLYHIEVNCDWYIQQLQDLDLLNNSNYHLLYGPSPYNEVFQHAVVGINGKIHHDPHPDRKGLIGNSEKWTVGLLIPKW